MAIRPTTDGGNMMIEIKPDGSFRVHTPNNPWWYRPGLALYWLLMGVLLGSVATRAYFIILAGR
jgi:hypothetical protein